MMKNVAITLILTLCTIVSYAKTLCTDKEETIVSFQMKKSSKTASVCKGQASSYLVYRFGTPQKIELQYPQTLNRKSWSMFRFEGYHRGGGIENAAVEMCSLSFNVGEYEYELDQHWSAEENIQHLGIDVRYAKKSVTIEGNSQSQVGSICLLEYEQDYIANNVGN